MLATTEGTLALIAFEDDAPSAIYEHLPGSPTPLWPEVRMAFSIAFAETEHRTDITVPTAPALRNRKRYLRSLLPFSSDATVARERADVCFIVDGGTAYFDGTSTANWLIDDFAAAEAGRSMVLQWLPLGRGRPAFARTRSLDPLEARAELRANYLRPIREEQVEAVRRLVTEYSRLLPLPVTPHQLERVVEGAISQERIRCGRAVAFSRVLDRIQPRVVLMQSASYAGWSPFMHELKQRGIHVAEPQHGWIGPSHAAYNFGKAMYEGGLRSTLPDTLLTFGSFWSDSIRHPANLVAVGKPHLAEYAGKASKFDERPRTLLVASSVSAVDEACEFVLALRDALPPTWGVKFRPHPSERATCDERYSRLAGVAGVEFDLELDAYASLSQARAVAGVASTVLYEAAALGCAVYVRDSPYRDYYVGEIFGPAYSGAEGARALAESVVNGEAAREPLVSHNELWAPNPIENYSRWLSGVLN